MSEEPVATGRCACGQVSYAMAAPPFAVHSCHCTSCQRETGSAFALNGLVESEQLSVTAGEVEIIETPSNSGKGQRIARCPKCHVAVWSIYGGMGDLCSFVRTGTLDDPGAFPPDIQIFTRSKLPWVVLPDGAETREAYYSSRDYDDLFGPDRAERYRALRELTRNAAPS